MPARVPLVIQTSIVSAKGTTTSMGLSRVAVIGSGVTGLVTLKNLLEEGLNVTAFKNRDTIRGV